MQTIRLSELFKFMLASTDFESMSLLDMLLVVKGISVGFLTAKK